MASRGLTNNNYLNLKNGTSRWMDADGKESKTDSRGHAVFTDPVYGVRAGILLLRTYFFTHNLRTIAEILSRWAPATDTEGSIPGGKPNQPLEYSNFVSKRMGIRFDQKLELFNEDKSIGNVGQLRELFFAMAANEIGGGFKVPLKDFNAGLELVQPGIKSDGTETHSTNTALADSPVAPAIISKSKLGGSVGNVKNGAKNAKADVRVVQEMLRTASMILHDPGIDPGGIDEKIDRDPKESTTVKAIVKFQSRFFTRPDGVIEPEGRSWTELVRALAVGSAPVPPAVPASGTGEFFFPFTELPSANWTSPPRSFAANRDNGRRAHAGCDLYFPKGTTIHAVGAGTVIRGPYPFYAETFAIEIDHGSFVVRYGEVQASAFVREGDHVAAGQPIAKVGHLVGITVPSDMLHFELYDKSAHGKLTVPASESAMTPNGKPFMRRKDLIDPTPKLNEWKNNLPGAPVSPGVTATRAGGGVPAKGFCIHLQRIRQEKRSTKTFARTVGEYQCFWNGVALPDLAGQIVERGGPGDNTTEIGDNRDLRIRKGTYPLSIQDGNHYKTYGYNKTGTDFPKPGLLLEKTNERTAILLHPGVDYLSSIGCLNPATGLTDANSKLDFADSRRQVIAIIDEMKAKMGTKFPKSGSIPEAVILIEGEPT